jgi:hypothetical protein
LSLVNASAERELGLVDGLGCLVILFPAEEAQQVPALVLVGACVYKNRHETDWAWNVESSVVHETNMTRLESRNTVLVAKHFLPSLMREKSRNE